MCNENGYRLLVVREPTSKEPKPCQIDNLLPHCQDIVSWTGKQFLANPDLFLVRPRRIGKITDRKDVLTDRGSGCSRIIVSLSLNLPDDPYKKTEVTLTFSRKRFVPKAPFQRMLFTMSQGMRLTLRWEWFKKSN